MNSPELRRHLGLIALLFAASAGWAAPARADFDLRRYCPNWLRPFVGIPGAPRKAVDVDFAGKSPAFLRAHRIYATGFPGFPERTPWLSYPARDPRTQEWVELLLLLDDSERRLLRKAIHSRPIADPKLHKIAMLSLYDWDTWHAYFTNFSQVAQLDEALINSLMPVLRKMPEDLLQSLYDRIAPVYDNLSKLNARRVGMTVRTELRLAPKRAVDAFIRNTIRADETLSEGVKSGLHPLAAYSKFIRELRTRIFATTRKVSEYDANEVLAAGLAVQEVLRKNQKIFPQGEVLMTGSFPNGRAKLASSDVDCILSDPEMKPLLEKFDEAVNAVLRKQHPEAKLEFHTMRLTTTPNFAADINPMQIRVGIEKVELLVYGPEKVLYGDTRRLPFNYAEPESYVLNAISSRPVREGWPGFRTPALPIISTKIDLPTATKETSRTIDMDYAGLKDAGTWLANPAERPAIQRWVDALLSVSEAERRNLLAKIERNPPKDPHLRRVTELALYKESAWAEYYAEFSTAPQADRALFDAFTPIFANMPADLKKKLASSIRRDYPTLKKEKWVRTWTFRKKYLELGPKRAVDIAIRQLDPPAPFFQAGIREGKTASAVYGEYIALLRSKYFARGDTGGYSVDDILAAARDAQIELRKLPPGKVPHSLVMAGSFPTGRANLATSDVDVIPSHFSIEDGYPAIQERINAGLRKKYPKANLEVHSMFATVTEIDAAIVSPIMVRVETDRIEILVYPTFRPMPGDHQYLPQNYPPPLVFEVGENEIRAAG